MATTYNTMVFIGNLPDIDVDESNTDAELASNLAGTYHAFQDLELVTIESRDVDNNSAIYDNDISSPDFVIYTVGGVANSRDVDSTITYNALVTDVDGVVHDIDVVVVQMDNGDTFVGDMQNAGAMDNLVIRSIQLTTPITTDAAGYNTWQTMSGSAVCFGAGTQIDTLTGPVTVEHLTAGDIVLTRDHGPRPVGAVLLSHLPRGGAQAPVLIAEGALGPGVPDRPLALSPQHRVLVHSPIARRMFGTAEVLVPARFLTAWPGVRRAAPWLPVRYAHVVLDRHELLCAHAVPVESFFPGPQALQALDPAQRRRVDAVMGQPVVPCRPFPDGQRCRGLLRRHLDKGMPIVTEAEQGNLYLLQAERDQRPHSALN